MSHYTHMVPSPVRSADDMRRANEVDPLIDDHKGPKDNANEPARHELYLLGPGEKKVIEEPDTSKSSHNWVLFVLSSRSA